MNDPVFIDSLALNRTAYARRQALQRVRRVCGDADNNFRCVLDPGHSGEHDRREFTPVSIASVGADLRSLLDAARRTRGELFDA